MLTKCDRPVSIVGKDIAIGAVGVRFGSWAGQIGHSVTKYFFGAVLPSTEMGPVILVFFLLFFFGKILVVVQIKFLKTEKSEAILVN